MDESYLVFVTFFKLQKWYKIAQRITNTLQLSEYDSGNSENSDYVWKPTR